MDNKLPFLYRNYGQYSNWRNMPSDIDGLKPVERRVLLAAYKIARQKMTKSRKIDSYTNGNYHPHGECYGTIVQLVRQGFLEGQGNFGSNVGVEPTGAAASRYTECKISQRTVDLAFKYVDFVNWVDTELDDKEPEFLPTMYPFCLLGNEPTQGIGFGYKTYIPCYKVDDLQKRLMWLLGVRKTKPIIAPITDCRIKSPDSVLDELLTKGKAKIDVEGIIETNLRTNEVILRSWPPGKRFESFLNKFSKELSEGLVGFRDASVTQTEIIFQVLRERNRDKIFKDFIEKLTEVVKGSISFEITLVDKDNKVIQKSVDDMLKDTFNMFLNINKKMLASEIDKISGSIAELIALEMIRNPLSSCIKDQHSLDVTIDIIKKNTGVPEDTIKGLIQKYRISKLFTLSTDTSDLNSELKGVQDTLKNISDFVLNQYGGFK
jgi:DNA gyrase/topoisomerase IV subunit A